MDNNGSEKIISLDTRSCFLIHENNERSLESHFYTFQKEEIHNAEKYL